MESDLPVNMDKATFLAWAQTRERRCELVDGNVVMIGPNTRAHGLVAGNIATALDAAFDPDRWDVLMSFGVDAGPNTIRDPDILVDLGGDGKDVLTSTPVLLTEVLSPSSAKIDLGDKVAEYLKIPTLIAYLVLSQDEPKVWLWVRRDGTFAPGAEICAGNEAVIRIRELELELALSEVYAGIKFA